MRVAELVRYAVERGSGFEKRDGRLLLTNAKKLTPLLERALFARRAEVYQHFGLAMPSDDCREIESCPKCGHRMTDAKPEEGGAF